MKNTSKAYNSLAGYILQNFTLESMLYEMIKKIVFPPSERLKTDGKLVNEILDFKKIIRKKDYVGELIGINFKSAKVLVYDFYKKLVGGVSQHSFLVATKIDPNQPDKDFDYESDDSEIILLRVRSASDLIDEADVKRIKTDIARQSLGEENNPANETDPETKVFLGYSGLECKIIGTFYLFSNKDKKVKLKFGGDISNFYKNQRMKIYKPREEALKKIINYTCPHLVKDLEKKYGLKNSKVKVGVSRYSSTFRRRNLDSSVEFQISPADLLSQKTAVFGITRSGKSNTTKIIAASVYGLRRSKKELRVGQLIFDPNGEYANVNEQDKDQNNEASCLSKIYKINENSKKENEVVIYTTNDESPSSDKKLMQINFFDSNFIALGKQKVNAAIEKHCFGNIPNYLKRFMQADLTPLSIDKSFEEKKAYYRVWFLYQALLMKAGFKTRYKKIRIKFPPLDEELRALMQSVDYMSVNVFDEAKIGDYYFLTSDEVIHIYSDIYDFITNNKTKKLYKSYDQEYIKRHKKNWADKNLQNIMSVFFRDVNETISKMKGAIKGHNPDLKNYFVHEIYNDLKKGKLVIVDQYKGDIAYIKECADLIMRHIFFSNQKIFTDGNSVPEILVYAEEAHNILPEGSKLDTSDIWIKTAKEGAKYKIGMLYTTQEVSSIQKNILKNTSNWFVSHLNNRDEIKELCKYYDFEDFSNSILNAQEKGFTRIKTLSNPFVVPVQIDEFKL